MGERKYGPEKEDITGECDQRYIIYYSLNGNKATVHHTAAGAKVDIPFKLGNASANANYDGNWALVVGEDDPQLENYKKLYVRRDYYA